MSSAKRVRVADPDQTAKQDGAAEAKLQKISLPSVVDLDKFVSSRKDELVSLTETVKVKMRKLVSQQLPHHLRRRTVSHNKKRLPKRLQNRAHSDEAKKTKRPAKLHRPRPRNLKEEYARRSGGQWLETHVWHAKRFKMKELYGYKIPYQSFDKSIRANLRGASQYCLLNDMSYMSIVEIKGDVHEISKGLSHLTPSVNALPVDAKKFIDGKYSGDLNLYKPDSYPRNFIGPASFFWRPAADERKTGKRTLWLKVHPLMKAEVLTHLGGIFDIEMGDEFPNGYAKYEGAKVTISDLSNRLNILRLTGPLSVNVLCQTLTQDPGQSSQNKGARNHNEFWENLGKNALSAFSYLRDGQIIGNLVLDPRLHMPKKRMVSTEMMAPISDEDVSGLLETECPLNSDLWDRVIPNEDEDKIMTQHEINELRSKSAVPGSDLALGEAESRIPILVTIRSGSQDRLGYSRGCDIIIPVRWGRQFFIALNYRSARATSLLGLTAVTRHSYQFMFPDDACDSSAARLTIESETRELRERHFKYPPNKRPNFEKLGIKQPYEMAFDRLLRCGNAEDASASGFVIRDREILKILQKALRTDMDFGAGASKLESSLKYWALVPVKLTCLGTGVPERFARITFTAFADAKAKASFKDRTNPSKTKEKSRDISHFYDVLFDPVYDSDFATIGFVTCGFRNFYEKRSTGLAYVSLRDLLRLKQNGLDPTRKIRFAFRNQNSFVFHPVQMEVII